MAHEDFVAGLEGEGTEADANSLSKIMAEGSRRLTPLGTPDCDGIRRDRLKALYECTGRPVVLYATDFLTGKPVGNVSLEWSDKDGFIEVMDGIKGSSVDVMIHSPGGMAEAAESIVALLRSRFDDVRFIVPNIAKSAATMLALSGNEILMNDSSELGPIDPQFRLSRPDGSQHMAPAQAIIDQFEEAQGLIKNDPALLTPWLPILQQYGPALYKQAQNAIALSKFYVTEWLTKYMFKEDSDGRGKAKKAADYLSDHNRFKSHARRIDMFQIKETEDLKSLKVVDMRSDARLHDCVRGLYNATNFTFMATPAYKLFESSSHRTLAQMIQFGIAGGKPPPKTEPPPASREKPHS